MSEEILYIDDGELVYYINENEFITCDEIPRPMLEGIKHLQQKVDRLNNIIEELEKWCNECIDNHIIARENGVTTISDTFFEIVLDKLKALKENK